MSKTMVSKGFKFTQLKNGKIKINYEKWNDVVNNMSECGQWVWNMADNHDISHDVCVKLCKWLGKNMLNENVNTKAIY